ncbi:MAG: AmmeMemoRadiSam system protein B [Syntrophobacteraceae bacterium]|nr:AmmeMemoRadiSam system protein B [Syntrophobacteraceae bacterium]
MDDYPKLRDGLEAAAVEHEDQKMVLITDRLGFSEMPLIMSPLAASLLELMDGEHSLRDLQAHCMRATGQMVFMEDLQGVLHRLDESLFLDNENFRNVLGQRMAQFHDDPVRRMRFAGSGYPAEAPVLKAKLDSFFSPETGGPGLPFQAPPQRRLLGLVAPHIDINAGGPCFAHAYKALSESFAPDTWVILGTGHEPIEHHFALTAKDYETPLGLVQVDREAIERVNHFMHKECNVTIQALADDDEHSLEIELPFLQRALSGGFRLLPIMVHTYSEAVLKALGKALATILAEKKSPLMVASTDLSHFYPENAANQLDGEMLKRIASFSPESVLQAEKTGVGFACGAGAVAAVLWAAAGLGANQVITLHHSTSAEQTGDRSSVVGYGAAVILKPR